MRAASVRWDEWTATEFAERCVAAKGVCVLPVASLEQHGGHLPLGTDAFVGEAVCRRAAVMEPMALFPVLPFGVNGEAMAYPGGIALKTETLFTLLLNLCDEIARNGFDKILLFSSHGGNGYGLPFFVQQWATVPRDYLVYCLSVGYGDAKKPEPLADVSLERPAAHGATYETSAVLAARPETVRLEREFPRACAERLDRLAALTAMGVYTPVSYYANYPNHWAGPATHACEEAGNALLDERARKLAEAVRAIKADRVTPGLMREFRDRARRGGVNLPETEFGGRKPG
jgi:creatinine amidohydrolase